MKTLLGVALTLLMVVLLMAAVAEEVLEENHTVSPEIEDWYYLYERECSGVYHPYCSCVKEGGGPVLTCDVYTHNQFDFIRNNLIQAEEMDFYQVTFSMKASLDIPENALGAIKTEWLTLSCSDSSTPLGPIHENAFKSTQNRTNYLNIQDCDLTNTSFAFLSQFYVLESLTIESSSIKELLEMPYLPQLKAISFSYGTTKLEKWYNSSQTPNLDSIYLIGMPDLDDLKVDSILSSMTDKFIYPKLENLSFYKSNLTRVPPLVSIFPALIKLVLSSNPIKTLAAGSIQKGSTRLKKIDIYLTTELTTIEPGAFVGDFSSSEFGLYHNPSMTSFPSAVFKDLLKSMMNHDGFVWIEKNPIAFDCNLKWLLVDNRDLLPYVRYGSIANGTRFEDLNPEELIKC